MVQTPRSRMERLEEARAAHLEVSSQRLTDSSCREVEEQRRKRSALVLVGSLVGACLVVAAIFGWKSWRRSASVVPGPGLPLGPLKYICNAEQIAANCTDCSSPLECLKCAEGHQLLFLYGEVNVTTCEFMCTERQKLMDCTKCKDEHTCTACSEGFKVIDGICSWQCDRQQLDAGCTECKSVSECTKCEEGMELVDGACVFHCTPQQVELACTSCRNATICTVCREGTGLAPWKGECVDECLAAGETDYPPWDLGLAPEFRNGFAFQRMCVDEEEAHFFAIGDWGGFEIGYNGQMGYHGNNEGVFESPNPDAKYGSAGDLTKDKPYNYDIGGIDGHAQKLVADQMNELAKTKKPRFVVNVGDSFYWGGFEDIGCGGDPKKGWDNWRWTKVWMDLYNLPHPIVPDKQIPWFSVLGNHDYGGIHMDSGWDHQVYYTYKPGGHWRMPGLWWSQEVRFRRFSMEIFFVEGNYIDAFPEGIDPSHNICGKKDPNTGNGRCEGRGIDPLIFGGSGCMQWFHDKWEQSKSWLERKLKESQAHWTAVVAHYPENCGDEPVMNMMKEYGVDMCIVGSTHRQEITQRGCSVSNPCTDRPVEVITGGGGGVSAEAKSTRTNNMYGFVDFTLTRDRLRARVVNQNGHFPHPEWNLPRRLKTSRGES